MSGRFNAKVKCWVINNKTNAKFNFQFNPTTFTYARGVEYGDIIAPAMAYPDTQFIRGKAREFTTELYMYDNPYKGLIVKAMQFFGKLLTPETNVKGYKKPPECTFCYSYFIRKCVVTNLEITIKRMDESNQPIEAVFKVTFRQVGV